MKKTLWMVLFGWLLASCAGSPAGPGPRAWIDEPLNGAALPLGPLLVRSHIASEHGVVSVTLLVNGEAARTDSPSDPSGRLVEITQVWMPPAPGEYRLAVRATDSRGNSGESAPVQVRVGQAALPSPAPTQTPAQAAETPAPVPTPTAMPTLTAPPRPTPTPRPLPGPTPTPAPRVNFGADRTQITSGECATLFWDVEHIQGVYLDGQGVIGRDQRTVCPQQTTTYILRVIFRDGRSQDYPVTIQVLPLPTPTPVPPTPTPVVDTQPPPAPWKLVPSNQALIDCRASTLSWNAVSDPSGIRGYDVVLEWNSGNAWVVAQTWTSVPNTEVPFTPWCGSQYRWRVRAIDNAGNVGPWSADAYFDVILP
ncbi:MAG: hypothetical protein RMM10_04940 [Anaerolineae bacterium]|uniref:hypothetical protein n=1 Tax=Thermoflexus sp. TaxID=1969742 RepID=UPI00260153FA|nr:hypothetical protein [Thermoflexus sp.]MCS7350855.1 hypothetical protein [Thermoflexus sp.]MDW8180306.1 hypothetical protein [Anaerolineae bacterium]